VRIDPQYEGAVVYVKDASRAVGVCQQLIAAESRALFTTRTKAEHVQRRIQHGSRRAKSPTHTLAQARANRPRLDWSGYVPPVPRMLGVRTFDDYSVEELARYIDWTPFSRPGNCAVNFPTSSAMRNSASRPAVCMPMPARCCAH